MQRYFLNECQEMNNIGYLSVDLILRFYKKIFKIMFAEKIISNNHYLDKVSNQVENLNKNQKDI